MKRPRLRFTTQEKLAILKEIDLVGLEPILAKYKLNVKALVHWRKKFKGANAGNSIHFKAKHYEKKDLNLKPEKLVVNVKEEELLRLVATLIVQSLLKEDSPDR